MDIRLERQRIGEGGGRTAGFGATRPEIVVPESAPCSRRRRLAIQIAVVGAAATAALLMPCSASGQHSGRSDLNVPKLTSVRSTLEPGPATDGAHRPFRPGETLEYRARFGRLGEIGKATMSVEGPVKTRGHEALVLGFELRGRFGPFRIQDVTRSWVCDRTLASLRYHKDERHPLSSRSERVEIYPEEGRWTAGGDAGEFATDLPLDELSFIYHLRTLDLKPGSTFQLDHHFDSERNPVHVRVVARERIRVPAGEFTALHVQMRVSDGRVAGDGLLDIYFTDDSRRIPVMIESDMPMVGTVRLSLESGRL